MVAYPYRKDIRSARKSKEQLTAADTRLCAVDLNLDHHLAVCSVQTVDGTILATSFIGKARGIGLSGKNCLDVLRATDLRLASLPRTNRTMPTSGPKSGTWTNRSRTW